MKDFFWNVIGRLQTNAFHIRYRKMIWKLKGRLLRSAASLCRNIHHRFFVGETFALLARPQIL